MYSLSNYFFYMTFSDDSIMVMLRHPTFSVLLLSYTTTSSITSPLC